MLESLFKPPMIGPFVERNDRAGEGRHIGARITWTAAGEAYALDLVRIGGGPFWYDTLGFDQTSDFDFEDFCWFCFMHSSRLREFLNELRQYIRPSSGAPTNAPAGSWLHSKLVDHDFTIGIPKFRKDSVRVPVVWVFGGKAAEYGARGTYSKVGIIDWSPQDGAQLNLSQYVCWGTGARALNRLFDELVRSIPGEPLLTDAGVKRMQELWQNGLRRAKPVLTPARLQANDKEISARLRKSLGAIRDPISPELAREADLLSEKAYSGLLRSCVTCSDEDAAVAMLKHRKLPEYGRRNLLEHFIDLDWLKVWPACGKEAEPLFIESRYGRYNEMMRRVLIRGNPALFTAVLGSFSAMTMHVAQNVLEDALEEGRDDIAKAILDAPVVKPHAEEALLRCFVHGLSAHRGPTYCKRPDLAMHLLDMGVRPICAIKPDDWFGPKRELLEVENLPVLKRALELEPPTQESITALIAPALICSLNELNDTFVYLVGISRGFPGHVERMTAIAFDLAIHFIRLGTDSYVQALKAALQEGASLTKVPLAELDPKKQRLCLDATQQGFWIDLISYLAKWGYPAEAEVIKHLKRAPKSARANQPKAVKQR